MRNMVRSLADGLDVTTPGVEEVLRRGSQRRRFANAGVVAVSVVLAAAVVLPLLSVLPIGDGGDPLDIPEPSAIMSPAPRECPVALGVLRDAGPEVGVEEFTRLMHGYLPGWLPDGFGLLHAFGPELAADGSDASGVWTDASCREILLRFNGSWRASEPGATYDPDVPQVGPWSLVTDVAGGCGNEVLGQGRCLAYAASTEDGLIAIEMMGLEREEGDRIALSILDADAATPEPSPERMRLYASLLRVVATQDFPPTGPIYVQREICRFTELSTGSIGSKVGGCPDAFSEAEQADLKERLASLGEIRFVESFDDVRLGQMFVWVGPIEQHGDELRAGGGMWCGGLCGQGGTFELGPDQDRWRLSHCCMSWIQ
ncbi:MAG: hypothetical protein WD096_06530 [Actinomycetota bacterium]